LKAKSQSLRKVRIQQPEEDNQFSIGHKLTAAKDLARDDDLKVGDFPLPYCDVILGHMMGCTLSLTALSHYL
jgi:hypothetical protein